VGNLYRCGLTGMRCDKGTVGMVWVRPINGTIDLIVDQLEDELKVTTVITS
jgi:hypothetical protein